jgi:predicted DsbA family dithiol-disulfide isomerase
MGLTLIEYTDPACPFCWAQEPVMTRLRWLYGEDLSWRSCMVVLSHDREEVAAQGFTPAIRADFYAELAQAHGMPFEVAPRPHAGATRPSCQAVVAARLHAPAAEAILLRALRVEFMTTLGDIDDPATIAAAAVRAGLDPNALADWMETPEVEIALARDAAEARRPTPAALHLGNKLKPAEDGEPRYSAPSVALEDEHGRRFDLPGFAPALAFEYAIANLAPELPRRLPPASVEDLLSLADFPLATREIAMALSLDDTAARELLHSAESVSGAAAGDDYLWTTSPAGAPA